MTTGGTVPLSIVQNGTSIIAKAHNNDYVTYDGLSNGVHTHIAVTHESKTVTLYVNGSNEGTAGFASDVTNDTMTIGNGLSNSDNVRDLGVWTRVLSNEEIQAHQNDGTPTNDFLNKLWHNYPAQHDVDFKGHKITSVEGTGDSKYEVANKDYVNSKKGVTLQTNLHAYFSFDKNGSEFADLIGDNDALQGGGKISAGKIGNAYDTQGGQTIINVGNAMDWQDGDFSVSMWVKPDDTDINIIYTNAEQTNFYYDTDGTFILQGGTEEVTSNNTFSTGDWYHVVMTRTGSEGKICVNGIRDGDGTIDDGNITITPAGGSANVGSFSDQRQILIDEIGVWYRGLTLQEVQHLYNDGKGTQDFLGWSNQLPQGDVNMNGKTFTNVGSSDDELATKSYVDNNVDNIIAQIIT